MTKKYKWIKGALNALKWIINWKYKNVKKIFFFQKIFIRKKMSSRFFDRVFGGVKNKKNILLLIFIFQSILIIFRLIYIFYTFLFTFVFQMNQKKSRPYKMWEIGVLKVHIREKLCIVNCFTFLFIVLIPRKETSCTLYIVIFSVRSRKFVKSMLWVMIIFLLIWVAFLIHLEEIF